MMASTECVLTHRPAAEHARSAEKTRPLLKKPAARERLLLAVMRLSASTMW